MTRRKLTVAVTGLNATDNPGPGISVIRALRAHPDFDGRIVGLAYDTLDPGIYARDIVDDVFLIPYPSEGKDALANRLAHIQQRIGIDVVLPTLDSELLSFVELAPDLEAIGVGTFLPSREQFEARAKTQLVALGERAGIDVPRSRTISDPEQLYRLHEDVPYPLYLKGPFYGADLVRSPDEAVAAYHRFVASWGGPVIAQEAVLGDELDVVAVGDGEGGLVGALPMKKTTVTDKGKGWAGVAIRDPALLELAEKFAAATQWRGPCELEVLRTAEGRYALIEVNPRFPAWVFLTSGAGINLPYATIQLAAGEKVSPMREYRAGTMFVRIAVDLLASIEDFSRIAQQGELLAQEG